MQASLAIDVGRVTWFAVPDRLLTCSCPFSLAPLLRAALCGIEFALWLLAARAVPIVGQVLEGSAGRDRASREPVPCPHIPPKAYRHRVTRRCR